SGNSFSYTLPSQSITTFTGTSGGGSNCPSGANYFNPLTNAHGTLSSLGVTSCYYVAANGSDSNNGTSESTPWLHAPGMANCSGNCAAVTPGPGAGFVFRGGDTWHFGSSAAPATGGTWTWQWSGSSGSPIYIGVDPAWYAGGSWARPVLTGDNPVCNSSSCSG